MFKNKKKLVALVAAYKTAFSGEAGHTVLIDLMRKCSVVSVLTDQNSAIVSAFNDGKRSAVLDIFKMIGIDEARLIALIKESEEYND